MKLPDDIKEFLPRYLTEESTQVLLQQIDDYAKEGTTDKVYAYPLSNDETIYQGDGICDLPIFQYKLGTVVKRIKFYNELIANVI